MVNGYKFRLYPNLEQQQTLRRWIGCQRLIYNAKVQEDRYFRRFQRQMVGNVGIEIPVDQQYSRFITERTPFLREVPSQILRNGATKFANAYKRFFQKLGRRPKLHKKSGRQAVWVTSELFEFIPITDAHTGKVQAYHLHVGTNKFPVGILPYVAQRPHAIPASIHIVLEAGQWWVAFAAEDPDVTLPGQDSNAAIERIAEDLRHLSAEQLTEHTLGGDRGVDKPLMTSEGTTYDLLPVQKKRIKKHRRRKKQWQRKAARRKKGSKNQQKAYRKVAHYQQYEKHVRHEYAHQTSHALVVHLAYNLYAFEDLPIQKMTKRPKAKQDASGRFLPNKAAAKAGLNRAILTSAWGEVVTFTRYKALRHGKLVLPVPYAYSSQECAVCTFTSPDNRQTQADFVCQRCGHTDNADHNAAVVIAKRGIQKILSGDPLTKPHKTTRIYRKLGPERKPLAQSKGPKPRLASYTASTGGRIV